MSLEELREQAATAQGWADEILDLATEKRRVESPACQISFSDLARLQVASDDLNSAVARIDALQTGFGTKMLDPEAERARRGRSKRS